MQPARNVRCLVTLQPHPENPQTKVWGFFVFYPDPSELNTGIPKSDLAQAKILE